MADRSPSNPNVLSGRDDWLYLSGGAHRQFDFLLGNKAPTAASTEAFADNVERRVELCTQWGVPYVHLVSPAKPVVMPEYLPESVAARMTSLYEARYLPEIRKRNLDSHVLYPRAPLQAGVAGSSPYRVRDTHMTEAGSLWSAQHIFDALGGGGSDLSAHFGHARRAKQGDLAMMVGDEQPYGEDVRDPTSKAAYFVDTNSFLRTNTGQMRISRNPAAIDDRRLLVFGDSFLNGTFKFFIQYFREVIFMRSSSLQADVAVLAAPDLIVTGNAERYLANVLPDAQDVSFLSTLWKHATGRPDEAFLRALAAQIGFVHHSREHSSWAQGIDASF